MNYRSYYDISLAIWQYIPQLPVGYDLIVGVPQMAEDSAKMRKVRQVLDTYRQNLNCNQ